MIKGLIIFSLLLTGRTSLASLSANEVCGLLTKEKTSDANYVQYFLSFGTTPENQQKMKLVARTEQVKQYMSGAYNNSAVCVIATYGDGEGALLVEDIYNQTVGAPRVGRSN